MAVSWIDAQKKISLQNSLLNSYPFLTILNSYQVFF